MAVPASKNESLPVGGRLLRFAPNWEEVTADRWLLDTVSKGYKIEFTAACQLTTTPTWTVVPKELDKQILLREYVQGLLEKAAIRQIDPNSEPPGFYSTVFLTEKSSGGWRPILNLKPLNKTSIKPQKFRQETLRTVMNSLGESRLRKETESELFPDRFPEPGPWASTIDLKDAYFHVPIHQEDTKYLRFTFEGRSYEFLILPLVCRPLPEPSPE